MESIRELKGIVEKGITRQKYSAMYFIEPVQVYFTKALLLLHFNRISASLLWLAVGLTAGGLFLTGNPWLGMVALVLHFVETVLDGADGQVARYNKRHLSEEDDVRLWATGLYLDYHQHLLVDSVSLGFFAIGLYRVTGNELLLVLGVFGIYFRMYRRARRGFRLAIARALRHKDAVLARIAVTDVERIERLFVSRVIDRLFFHIQNGKRLHFWMLLAHIPDVVLPPTGTWLGPMNVRGAFLVLMVGIGAVGVLKETLVATRYRSVISDLRS